MLQAEHEEVIRRVIEARREQAGALLPILHGIQDALGFVPPEATAAYCQGAESIARRSTWRGQFLSLLPNQAAGTAYGLRLPGRILPGDGCRPTGRTRQGKTGCRFPRDHPDGKFTLEPIYCLGNCACSPAMMVDEEMYGRVSPSVSTRYCRRSKHEHARLCSARFLRAVARCRVGGACDRAEAARRKADVQLVRNGSRGLYWLEPMVEVDTPQGRVAYGPVTTADVAIFVRCQISARQTACVGPWSDRKNSVSAKQERLTFARVGITDPVSLADYAAHGGWKGLRPHSRWMAQAWSSR